MEAIIRIIDNINKLITVVIGIFLALMTVSVVYQVVSRFLLGDSLSWSEEIARYLMIWSVFLGAALALRKHSLIAVEVIAENIPHQAKRFLKIAVYLVSIIFFVMLFLKGVDMLSKVKMQLSPAMQISMAIPYAGIPVGAAALTMNAIAVILELILDRKSQPTEETI